MPLICAGSLLVVVLLCVVFMCKFRATRFTRQGIVGQMLFGLIILAAFGASAFPFTNFIRAIENSSELSTEVKNACDTALQMDIAYEKYVTTRVQEYKENLELIARSKSISPENYKLCMGDAAGATDTAKIEYLTTSLRNNLIPDSTANIIKARTAWLTEAREASVWNPLTPANVSKVDSEVSGWVDNYKNLSKLSYKGEESKPFSYPQFTSQVTKITQQFRELQMPSAIAWVVSLLCYAIMLLPWFTTPRNIATHKSKDKEDYE